MARSKIAKDMTMDTLKAPKKAAQAVRWMFTMDFTGTMSDVRNPISDKSHGLADGIHYTPRSFVVQIFSAPWNSLLSLLLIILTN